MNRRIILTLILTGSFAIACQSNRTENSNTAATSGGSANAGNVAVNAANLTANVPNVNNVNAAPVAKPADTAPKRIAFNKGANWGAANITLAPGAAQKFVVGARSGQTMDVEVSSKETSVNLLKGKAQTTEDFGYLNAELQANGDYVFEVRNSTKKEIKTSVKVTIEGANNKTGDGQGGYDGDDEPASNNADKN